MNEADDDGWAYAYGDPLTVAPGEVVVLHAKDFKRARADGVPLAFDCRLPASLVA